MEITIKVGFIMIMVILFTIAIAYVAIYNLFSKIASPFKRSRGNTFDNDEFVLK